MTAAGMWSGVIATQQLTMTLAENGGIVSGTGIITNTPTGTRALSVAGTFVSPTLTITLNSGASQFNLTGRVTDKTTLVANLNGSGFNGDTIVMNRPL